DPPAAPAGADPDGLEMPDRRGVVQGGEGVMALRRLGLPVVEHVPVGSHHDAIIPFARLVPGGRRGGNAARRGSSTAGNKAERALSTGPHADLAVLAD